MHACLQLWQRTLLTVCTLYINAKTRKFYLHFILRVGFHCFKKIDRHCLDNLCENHYAKCKIWKSIKYCLKKPVTCGNYGGLSENVMYQSNETPTLNPPPPIILGERWGYGAVLNKKMAQGDGDLSNIITLPMHPGGKRGDFDDSARRRNFIY